MEENKDTMLEVLRNLEILNQQVSVLVKLQRKEISGYDYLNANELADLIGESIKTIYARVYHREIPYYKPGGKLLLFKFDEILEWIKSGRHATMDEIRERI